MLDQNQSSAHDERIAGSSPSPCESSLVKMIRISDLFRFMTDFVFEREGEGESDEDVYEDEESGGNDSFSGRDDSEESDSSLQQGYSEEDEETED
jgi:hypothetical protein